MSRDTWDVTWHFTTSASGLLDAINPPHIGCVTIRLGPADRHWPRRKTDCVLFHRRLNTLIDSYVVRGTDWQTDRGRQQRWWGDVVGHTHRRNGQQFGSREWWQYNTAWRCMTDLSMTQLIDLCDTSSSSSSSSSSYGCRRYTPNCWNRPMPDSVIILVFCVCTVYCAPQVLSSHRWE